MDGSAGALSIRGRQAVVTGLGFGATTRRP